MEPTAPLYARGAYRVLTASEAGDAGPRPFVVVDTAGTRLREEASFDVARAWVDDRAGALVPPPSRSRRR